MTQPTTTESEAMEVFPAEAMTLFLHAFKATGLDFNDDQDNLAAARVIAAALEARDAVITALVGAFTDPEAGEIDRRLAIKDARAILTKQELKS